MNKGTGNKNVWRHDYEGRFLSPEEAAAIVRSGNRVAFTQGIEPFALSLALAARKDDLKEVRLLLRSPGRDLPWYEEDWQDAFKVEIGYILPVASEAVAKGLAEYAVGDVLWRHAGWDDDTDILITEVSQPDEHGFCSFGSSLWEKKQQVRKAKLTIAEVNPSLIRTCGDNYIHFSEIDHFVEHRSSGRLPGGTDLLGRKSTGPGEIEKSIAFYVGTLVRDGDTLEIGVGGTAEFVVELGALKERQDLGWHSENTPKGIINLVKQGVINGRLKKLLAGKAVATAMGGGNDEEMRFVNMNPLFELHPSSYVLDPSNIASNDNAVSINSALAVDLTGQIAAESLGPTMISGTGGQLAFAVGSNMSRGGRFITAMTSTTRGGAVSRIVPQLAPGTIVTVPRTLADLVVTEFGIAKLKGKTQKQRAAELIAVAHPDFRQDLRLKAAELFR